MERDRPSLQNPQKVQISAVHVVRSATERKPHRDRADAQAEVIDAQSVATADGVLDFGESHKYQGNRTIGTRA